MLLSAFEIFGGNTERLGQELFYLFKNSPAMREDYEKCQDKMGIVKHVFIRHVSSRWLTLEDVTERIFEQLPALKSFFTQIKEKDKTDRIKNICRILEDKFLETEILFLKMVLPVFTSFNRMFQAKAPLIHMLHNEMENIIWKLASKFFKPDYIASMKTKSVSELILDKPNFAEQPNIGVKAQDKLKFLHRKQKISDAERLKFYYRCQQFYVHAVKYLLKTLPLNNTILKNAILLDPTTRQNSNNVQKVKLVAAKISGFFDSSDVDTLTDEFLMYQVEVIPDEWYIKSKSNDEIESSDDESVGNDINSETDRVLYHPIDVYWNNIFQITKQDGLPKYPKLTKFVKILLTLSHGNADVERGFSFNKELLTDHRTSLSQKSINGLRITADYIKHITNDDISRLTMNNILLGKIKHNKSLYKKRMSEQNKSVKRPAEEDIRPPPKIQATKDLQQKRAAEMEKEGMAMLQVGINTKDFKKIDCANIILKNAKEMKLEAEK